MRFWEVGLPRWMKLGTASIYCSNFMLCEILLVSISLNLCFCRTMKMILLLWHLKILENKAIGGAK